MRDVDELMAHEAEQQELVDGIIRSLHQATEEHYLVVFSALALQGLAALDDKSCVDHLRKSAHGERQSMIAERIGDFTSNEIERKLLLSHVVRKLFDPVLNKHQANYLRQSILADAA